jgi:signal transduction histidine kinase
MMRRDASRVGDLVHEMRNQLAVARANLEAFLDGKLSPNAERLEAVLQTLRELEELIKDLRVMQLDAPMPSRMQEIDVCAMLQREYTAVEAVAAEKRVSLSVFRCPHPKAQCQRFIGDPVRVAQIVKNVLLNAVRYTPTGGSVAVDCSRRADQLEVRISDSGPGVADDDAPHIFEAGYRGEGAKTVAGAGVGLSVVKRLVEEHGGSIALGPKTAQGATFTLRLPGALPEVSKGCAAEGSS